MTAPDVTICIPSWNAEAFIDRTLDCARAQTYRAVRILVSVDACGDRTANICRTHARKDARVEVIVQRERLGWSMNANALLDRVDTPYFFLYFHDDIIVPSYTEKLLGALRARPDAMSVHCDLERFGNESAIDPGHAYEGTACHRLMSFLVGPVKGTPLRSLIRSDILRGLRFPEIGTDGFWRCHPFLLNLLAAGPALHCPEVLYRRWFRDGSLTRNWAPTRLEDLVEGQRQSAGKCLQIIDGLDAAADEKQLVRYCLRLFMLIWTRQHELKIGNARLIDAAAISPALDFATPPPGLERVDAELQAWVRRAAQDVAGLETRHAQLSMSPG